MQILKVNIGVSREGEKGHVRRGRSGNMVSDQYIRLLLQHLRKEEHVIQFEKYPCY
jgi:hypothetical protein